jgi:hypothetical protein
MNNGEPYTRLEPMTVREIFRESISLYRENSLKLIGIVAPNAIVWLIFLQFIFGAGESERMWIRQVFFPILIFLSSLIGTAVGAIIISDRFLNRETTISQAYLRIVDDLSPLLGSLLLVSIAITLGFILVIPGLILYAWFCLTPVVVVIEGEGGIGSLKRSRSIVKEHFSKAFLLVPLLTIIQMFVWLALLSIPGLSGNSFPLNALAIFLAILLSLLIESFKIVTTTLLYYDLRIRKEGFDLKLMAEELAASTEGLKVED